MAIVSGKADDFLCPTFCVRSGPSASDRERKNRKSTKFYHGKSKCFGVFDGLCDMLIIRYRMRMTGFQERNFA